MADRQFGKKVQTIRTDNGTEFVTLAPYFRDNGIRHQTSCTYTPQQNGRVERKHRHILNVARACLFQSRLPVEFWGESILAAAHMINRTPTQVLDGKTPYEVLHGTPPIYDQLRVFGCLCYAHTRPRDRDKFSPRSRKCLFVGYPFGKKAWRLYDLESNEFFTSRDVAFLEDQFPGIENAVYVKPPVIQTDLPADDWLLSPEPPTIPPASTNESSETINIAPPSVILPADSSNGTPVSLEPVTPTSPSTPSPTSSVSPTSSPSQSREQTEQIPSPGLLEVLGRGQRAKKPSVLLKNYLINSATTLTPPHGSHTSLVHDQSSPTTGPGKTLYPISDYSSTTMFTTKHQAFLAKITTDYVPKTYKEAVKDPRFNGAMKSEVTALEDNHTWDVTPLPPGKRAISCR